MLCNACHAALTTNVEGRMCWDNETLLDIVHHPTSKDFNKAVEAKCHICLNLLYQWEHKFGLRLPFPQHLDQGITHRSGDEATGRCFSYFYLCRGSELMMVRDSPWYTSTEKSYYIIVYLDNAYSRAVQSREIDSQIMCSFVVNPYREVEHLLPTMNVSKSTREEASFSLIRSWLDDCYHHHSICNEKRSGMMEFCPRRILDLSCAKARGDIFLMDTKNSPLEGPYATLSHCWGHGSHVKLLKNTIKGLQEGFRISKLPKVYREAIEIALRLEVSYLWIDSMCIVQDDKDDWLQEASSMFDIYSNAIFNIGATGAADGDGCCFVDHDPDLLGPCLFDAASERPEKPRMKDRLLKWNTRHRHTMPRRPDTTWHVVEESFWADRLYRQPLNQRAWVLQERLVSPRMIHFGRDQVYWECHQLHACETYPKGPQAMYQLQALKGAHTDLTGDAFKKIYNYKASLGPITNPLLPTMDIPANELALVAWSFIVTQYSQLELTMPGDKLIALSGLAKMMQGLIQDQYVAGLWRSSMIMGLLWRVDHRERRVEGKGDWHLLRDSLAPTWSWASVHGTVDGMLVPDAKVREAGAHIHIDIQDIDLTFLGDDGYGALSSAILHVEGRLWPAAFLAPDMNRHYKQEYGEHCLGSLNVNFPFIDLGWGLLHSIECTLNDPVQPRRPEDFGLQAKLHVIPILSLETDGEILTEGLILRESNSPEGMILYERFGHFEHTAEVGFVDVATKIMDSPTEVIQIV